MDLEIRPAGIVVMSSSCGILRHRSEAGPGIRFEEAVLVAKEQVNVAMLRAGCDRLRMKRRPREFQGSRRPWQEDDYQMLFVGTVEEGGDYRGVFIMSRMRGYSSLNI